MSDEQKATIELLHRTMKSLRDKTTDLEARINLALRLDRHNMPGFVSDALKGKDLSNIPLLKDMTLMGFLDACDKEDAEYAAQRNR